MIPFRLSSVCVSAAWPSFAKPRYVPTHATEEWQRLDAKSKQQKLWAECVDPRKPGKYPPLIRMPEVFTEDLNTTFDFVGDDMPVQSAGLEERPKLVHSVGGIAEVRFTIENFDQKYTGLFASGAANAFLRIGPGSKVTRTGNLIPGLSLKMMRSGVQSANVFALYTLWGQKSFNLFEHDLSTHIPAFDPSKLGKPFTLLERVFKKVSRYPYMIGLSDVARYDEKGVQVPDDQINFPFRLIFHPSNDVHSRFPSTPPDDPTFFLRQLQTLPKDTHIYDVYAEPTPTPPGAPMATVKIGNITMTTTFTPSTFGDRHLFFQHVRMEDDLALKPTWTSLTDEIVKWQTEHALYEYPDLPWE